MKARAAPRFLNPSSRSGCRTNRSLSPGRPVHFQAHGSVITGVARRRRWSEQDKARLVVESLEPGVVVAEVVRRYGIHRNQLYGWRSAFGVQPDRTEEARKAPAFIPVTVIPEAPVPGGLIQIVIGSMSVRLTGTVDTTALRQVREVIRSLS
jgi:transposase